MQNFAHTIFSGIDKAHQRVLLRWPEEGATVEWKGTQLLGFANGFSTQLSEMPSINGKAVVPMQSLTAMRFMAMLSVMGFGASLLIPPEGKWFDVLKRWRKDLDFGGVLLIDEVPLLLRLLLWVMRIPILLLHTKEVKGFPKCIDVPGDHTALISYSSGSTGKSKSLHRSHRVLEAQHQCLKRCFPPVDGQVDSSVFANVLLHQLATGTCSQLPADLSKGVRSLDYEALSADWRKGRVSTITGNPYFFNRMLALNEAPFLDVEACGIGGAPVDEQLLTRMQACFPNATIYVIYGATEVEPIALRPFQDQRDPRMGYAVGYPVECLSGLEIRNSHSLRAGKHDVQAGEIFVKGAHVLAPKDAWHGTGDYGYLLDGELYLTARSGNTEPCEHYHHYQIEHVLRLQDGVEQVAVQTNTDGVQVAYCGSLDESGILELAQQAFPEIQNIKVFQKREIPLDVRHHSKILYHQITYGN